ncbi:P27 family phage terminase small subunit [Pikeienuella sp. HZG-20]|uniref:P27 family phage terminase small subunit n=1 Tax=Paludibacillus litoralis TaxID=3133267 RepID=UPI0030EE84B9
MSERGRTPTLSGGKAMEGGRSIVVDPMRPEEIAQLRPPRYLKRHGREVWYQALRSLGPARHISHGDLATLGQGCLDWQRWRDFEDRIAQMNRAGDTDFEGELDTTPKGFRQMSQLRILADRAKRDWREVARQFGLTPVARVRTAGAAQGDFFTMLDAGPKKRDAAPAALDPTDPYADPPAPRQMH